MTFRTLGGLLAACFLAIVIQEAGIHAQQKKLQHAEDEIPGVREQSMPVETVKQPAEMLPSGFRDDFSTTAWVGSTRGVRRALQAPAVPEKPHLKLIPAAKFPDAVSLSNGELLVMGSGAGATHYYGSGGWLIRSSDGGRTWSAPYRSHGSDLLPARRAPPRFGNGLAAGRGSLRDRG